MALLNNSFDRLVGKNMFKYNWIWYFTLRQVVG